MSKYDIDEILKKKPLNREEIGQLKEKATSGNEQEEKNHETF